MKRRNALCYWKLDNDQNKRASSIEAGWMHETAEAKNEDKALAVTSLLLTKEH
jgi:uncharacterized protein (DUF2225 family)